jgi:Domain of unknown function (DUF4190)
VGQVEYDTRAWPQERLEDVLGTLARSNIAFEVEGGKLVVDESRKLTVGAIIASIVVDGSPPPPTGYEAPPPPPPPPGFDTLGAPPPPPPPGTVARAKVSSYAVASLVLGLVWLCGVGSVLAVVFGIMGIRQVNRAEGRLTGKGLAVAGLVLGILGVALVVASLVFGEDTTATGPR